MGSWLVFLSLKGWFTTEFKYGLCFDSQLRNGLTFLMSVPIDFTFKEQATDPWVMLCDTILFLRDKSEKQEGSTLTRPTDHDCCARPLFMGGGRYI